MLVSSKNFVGREVHKIWRLKISAFNINILKCRTANFFFPFKLHRKNFYVWNVIIWPWLIVQESTCHIFIEKWTIYKKDLVHFFDKQIQSSWTWLYGGCTICHCRVITFQKKNKFRVIFIWEIEIRMQHL